MALSKMMQHYLSVKEKYKDCLIFYRLGDFYEMFFDDAVKASELLDLTLTGRDCGLQERAPMCGVPHHAVDSYISKLVACGEKVAICEQLEDASQAKGMVDRGVVRVVTAGTLTDDSIDEKSNNFICCAYKNSDTVALAWADITTGELTATQFFGSECVKNAITKMAILNVKEVISNDEMLFASKNAPEIERGVVPRLSSYPEWAFGYSTAEKRLLDQLKSNTLAAFSIAGKKEAVSATGALLEYLKETQMHALKNIDSVAYIQSDSYMQLDNTAIRNLELVKNMGDGGKYGSLLWLLDKTKTAMGARFLNSVILSPLNNVNAINYRLDGVEELYEATVIRLEIAELLKCIKDIERIAGKVSNGNILPKDCHILSKSLAIIPSVKFKLSGFSSRILSDINEKLCDMSDICELLDNAISDELPSTLKDGGYIKEGFNSKLDELRDIKDHAGRLILDIETRERETTGIKNLRIHYNRVFGYYIEVTKSFIDKVPLHYQRRQTLANAERFTTEELKGLEEKILSSAELAIKLEAEIYEKIKCVLLECIDKIKTIASGVALLDVITSFAEVAKVNKYLRPEICESHKPLIIKDGRHPVVEVISKERFISNDALLDEGENRTMIITGPNMAGKSTYMRQIAVITIMAHIGSFVPAKSACIPITDRVFTRVGASDNLISDQSTFMVEMIEVATILQNATKSSLLILDEVGRGTSTYDGLSIAWAVIEFITNNIGAKTLFATHYHELTELENTLSGIKNYKISVKELNGSVVFLRKIMRGGANRSFGIEVASLAGIPSAVTDRAKNILKLIESGDKQFATKAKTDELNTESKSEVERILSEVDLNNLSPMQAFLLVSDLVEKVRK
ncbi:MAG: DNA mismatch repair protein MutS [Clostridiales bacterium]|nr:DNA mismatch repair protein MutS [Clostridiales bacterium]